MRRVFLTLFFLLALTAAALADDPQFSSTPGFVLTDDDNATETLRIGTEVGFIANSQFRNGPGSVTIVRTAVEADYSLFSLTYGLTHFAWQHHSDIRFKSSDSRVPWENLHDVTLQARLVNDTLAERWHYWLNGQVSSSFESAFPGAVGAGFDGGVAYDFWDGWMFGVSARAVALSALRDDLFGDVEFGMVVAASQKTVRDTLRAFGLMPNMPAGSDKIGFSLYLTGAENTYRLAPDSPVARNGYLGMRQSSVGANVSYDLDERWSFHLGPEYTYGRQFILYDSTGSQTSSQRLDNGWGGRFGFSYSF